MYNAPFSVVGHPSGQIMQSQAASRNRETEIGTTISTAKEQRAASHSKHTSPSGATVHTPTGKARALHKAIADGRGWTCYAHAWVHANAHARVALVAHRCRIAIVTRGAFGGEGGNTCSCARAQDSLQVSCNTGALEPRCNNATMDPQDTATTLVDMMDGIAHYS